MVPFSATPPGTWARFGEVWPFGLVVRGWDTWSLSLRHLLVLGLVLGEVWPFGLVVRGWDIWSLSLRRLLVLGLVLGRFGHLG